MPIQRIPVDAVPKVSYQIELEPYLHPFGVSDLAPSMRPSRNHPHVERWLHLQPDEDMLSGGAAAAEHKVVGPEIPARVAFLAPSVVAPAQQEPQEKVAPAQVSVQQPEKVAPAPAPVQQPQEVAQKPKAYCKAFQRNECNRKICKFLHELAPRRPCKYYALGTCRAGKDCLWPHIDSPDSDAKSTVSEVSQESHARSREGRAERALSAAQSEESSERGTVDSQHRFSRSWNSPLVDPTEVETLRNEIAAGISLQDVQFFDELRAQEIVWEPDRPGWILNSMIRGLLYQIAAQVGWFAYCQRYSLGLVCGQSVKLVAIGACTVAAVDAVLSWTWHDPEGLFAEFSLNPYPPIKVHPAFLAEFLLQMPAQNGVHTAMTAKRIVEKKAGALGIRDPVLLFRITQACMEHRRQVSQPTL